MPNMPEKDPGLWAAALAWLVLHQPQLFAAGLSVVIAVLRVMYVSPTRRHGFSQWLFSASRYRSRRRGSWRSARPT